MYKMIYRLTVSYIFLFISFVSASFVSAQETICTMEYDPVCGEDGVTYSNECVAMYQHNVQVNYHGACKKEIETLSVAPVACKSWYDGCNTCDIGIEGETLKCTKKACKQVSNPRCAEYYAAILTNEHKLLIEKVVLQRFSALNQQESALIKTSLYRKTTDIITSLESQQRSVGLTKEERRHVNLHLDVIRYVQTLL